MTALPKSIENQDGGAAFLRADLHIHSHGTEGSYDVEDIGMTPQAIVDSAIAKGVKIIAISDHHQSGNSKAAVEYAAGKEILVIPAVELSTNEGHVVVYAETPTDIEAIVAAQEFSEDRVTCRATMKQVLDCAADNNGFAIAAHINQKTGFENAIAGYGDPKKVVLSHGSLLGLELSSKDELEMFSTDDEKEERRLLGEIEVNGRAFKVRERARVMSSDAHKLSQLWKNPDGDERITRLKVNELTFAAVKTAFLDPTARIRIEDDIPVATPHFIGAEFEGGFLDGQIIKLNSNLNAIIGGKGSGKSTLLESIKVGSGNQADGLNNSRLVDKDVWPDKITLYFQDETGNITKFSRSKNGSLVNETDPAGGISSVDIESYSQGALLQLITSSSAEPAMLNEFLDDFIDFEDLKTNEDKARTDLMTNSSEIENLEAELAQLPKYNELFATADKKIKALRKGKVLALVDLEKSLAVEQSVRQEITQEIDDHKDLAEEGLKSVGELDIDELIEGKKIAVGKTELARIQELVTDYSKAAQDTSAEFATKTDSIIEEIETKLTEWGEREKSLLTRIEAKREQLVAEGVPVDMANIRTLSINHAKYERKIRVLTKQQGDLKVLFEQRTKLIERRAQLKRDIYAKRLAFAEHVNKQFADSIEYDVNVDYKQGLHSPDLALLIQEAMNWRTVQVPKAPAIAQVMSPADFLNAVRTKDDTTLKTIQDSEGSTMLSKTDIDGLMSVFDNTHEDLRRDLEELVFEDRPSIMVSGEVEDAQGNKVRVTKSFYQLSLGQQQAICLTILLNSGQNTPLVIDQPEDNLDSEFIFKTLVSTLRKVKERRQVIVVTHNANIAVLGDAELILPLRSSYSRATITHRGSIDKTETKKIACTILEGGETAFQRRREMYNL